MKTRDAEALEYVATSGHWRVTLDGEILTRRDKHGRVTSPEVWRPCEFISQGNRSGPRHRIWVNGRRVYSNRVVWRLTQGPIPDGLQVDHIDGDSLNRDPMNLQLLDCHHNIKKEAEAGRVFWFKPSPREAVIPAVTKEPDAVPVTFRNVKIDNSMSVQPQPKPGELIFYTYDEKKPPRWKRWWQHFVAWLKTPTALLGPR